jgi:hypothetical protein
LSLLNSPLLTKDKNYGSTPNNFLQISMNILNNTDASFTNFSSVTESTRIEISNQIKSNQTVDDDDTMISKNNTVVNVDQNRSLTGQIYAHKIDKRGETSNWIKDLDDDNNSLFSHASDLEPGSKRKVRIVPNTFSPSDFICQRLDMLSNYADLISQMNDHYRNSTAASCQASSTESQSLNFYPLNDSLEIDSENSLNYLIGKFDIILSVFLTLYGLYISKFINFIQFRIF